MWGKLEAAMTFDEFKGTPVWIALMLVCSPLIIGTILLVALFDVTMTLWTKRGPM
jgi:hypothetical protein